MEKVQMSIKISEFINDPWQAIAIDAMRRGLEITAKTGKRLDSNGTMIIGLCDVILEMQQRIEKMEGNRLPCGVVEEAK
jgi:hypothetical protein